MAGVPFAFDVDKLNNFVNGDIGIADTIHKAQIEPILNKIKLQDDKDNFAKLSKPDKTTGLWAIEKTVISSMLESQKPFIELAKICLELFASIEYVIAILTGGPNPKNNPSSFSGGFAASSAKMSTFKTGSEPDAPPAGVTPPPPPQKIFLGKWQRDKSDGDVYSLNTQPEHNEYWLGNYWPQYQTFDQYNTDQLNKLQPKIASLTPDLQQQIITGRFSSIDDEWSQMTEKNQLTHDHKKDLGNINISLFYEVKTIQINNIDVNIDIENDYDITVEKTTVDHLYDLSNPYYHDTFYIYATIKPDAIPQDPNNPNAAKAKPDPIIVPNLFKAVATFFSTAFDVIIKKLIPVIAALEEALSNPVKFIGDILMSKLKEHFVMFDPALKSKPADDPIRKKYWAGDKFVMDGVAAIDAGLLKITLGLKDGLPTFSIGKQDLPSGTKEQPILKQVANIVALPINLLKGILDEFKTLLTSLFNIPKLPSVMSDFISFKWMKDLLSLPSLLKFLGATGTLGQSDFTIPILTIPSAGNLSLVPSMITAFLKMIVGFLNGFIQIPNTILNVTLVPPIPTPS